MDVALTPVQVIPIAIFGGLMTVLGISGNSLVLYSSLRYNAIQMDKISLMYVRNLALADLVYTIFIIAPSFVTYAARKWIFGRVFCDIALWMAYISGSVNILTVLATTAYRLNLLMAPLRVIPTRLARVSVALTWLFGLTAPIVAVGFAKIEIVFHPEIGWCSLEYSDLQRVVTMILVGLFVVGPFFAIIAFNIMILWVAIGQQKSGNARASRGGFNYKALLTIFALSSLLILSWVPYTLLVFVYGLLGSIPKQTDLVASIFLWFNSVGNPILYTLTNRRFARYVHSSLRLRSVGNSSSMEQPVEGRFQMIRRTQSDE